MSEFFSSGRAADLVLLVMLLEAVVLAGWKGSPLRLRDVVVMLLPGACLVVALRAALTGADWLWIAAILCLAFAGHLVDLVRRLERGKAEPR